MTKKLTNEEFLKRFTDKYEDNYIIIGEYVNSSTPIEIIHRACGGVNYPRPNDLFNNQYYCNVCRKNRINSINSNQKFNNKIKTISNGRIFLVGNYKGYKEYVTIHCNKHNIDYRTKAVNVTRKDRITCPKCVSENKHNSQVKSEEMFKQQLHDFHNGTIVSLESYVNTHTKIKFKCTICNNVFKSEPNSVIRLSGCPYCNQYKGELEISKYLDTLGIAYESQKKFSDLKDTRNLSYDFFVTEYKLLIEYNGEQHYKPINFFGGKPAYEKQVKHDETKKKYAKENNYKLLTIRYTTNIDSIHSQIDSIINQ